MFIERGNPKKEEEIKQAFERVKTDIFSLGNELFQLKNDLQQLKQELFTLNSSISGFKDEILSLKSKITLPTHIPADQQINPTHPTYPTDNPTVPVEVRGLKTQDFSTWSGNGGVPTDKQTVKQTDNPTHFPPQMIEKYAENSTKSISEHILDASEILESLDILKKEIRLKFKQITTQEMLVFSTLYELEEKFPEGVSYEQIASKLKLSESSIRDYTQRLITKGVPILKNKLNNKKILLNISSDLKKIATLDTILRLREL